MADIAAAAAQGVNAFGALQNQNRQRMAYNALVNAYGPQAADPEAWGQATEAATKAALLPGVVPAQAASTAEAQQRARYTGAQAATSEALLPGVVPAQAAETGERVANTGNLTAQTATANAKLPFIAPEAQANIDKAKSEGRYQDALAIYEAAHTSQAQAETAQVAPNAASTRNLQGAEAGRARAETTQVAPNAASTRNLQGAEAGRARAETAETAANAASTRNLQGAQTGYAQAETARTSQQADDARRAAQQAQSLSVVNGAISERDNPHSGNLVQTPGQRAASFLSRLSPDAWAAMGVDQQHVQPVIQHLIEHPEDLDNMQAQLTGSTTGGLTQAGLQAAASMQEKGEPVSFGMGKQATAIRAKVMNLVAQDMKAGGGTAADAGGVIQDAKARQKYVSDLSGTSPTSAGGKVQSANALLNHIDLLSEYSTQLNNGTFRKGNDLSQALAREFGSVPPAQFEAQRNIVADELGRFLIARGGSTADREALKSEISKASSPDQLRSVIATYRSDMVGQLQGMAQQAHANGADSQFNAHLTPRVRTLLEQHGAAAAPAAPADGGFKYLGKE